jgi:hypothetical protein
MTAIMPPLVIDVRIRERGAAKDVHVWVPFFLLWPLLLVIGGFALVVALAVDLALWLAGARYHHYSLLLIGAIGLLAETRGIRAHIDNPDAHVDVDIY